MKYNKNDYVEARLSTAYEHATPEVLEAVRAACAGDTKGVTTMTNPPKNKTALWKKVLATAAALVLLVGIATGIALYRGNTQPETVISLEVNPSLSLYLDDNDTVTKVQTHNADAEKVVEGMELKGQSIKLAINALTGSMFRLGYLNDTTNSLLLTVEADNAQRRVKLQKELASYAEENIAVISQAVDANDEVIDQLVKQYGITAGKANLIQTVLANKPGHTAADLVGMSIHELNVLLSSAAQIPEDFVTAGQVSEKGYITREEAKNTARAYINSLLTDGKKLTALEEDDIELDYEGGCLVYEVEFAIDGIEYEALIDAVTGEGRHRRDDSDGPVYGVSTGATTGQTSGNAPGTTTGSVGLLPQSAKAMVLQHAGVSEADIRNYKCETDREDGRFEYEIEFWVGNVEYEYTVDGHTGGIIEAEIGGVDALNTKPADRLSPDQVKAIVLNHAQATAQQIQGYACELDEEGGIWVYEIEFGVGLVEHEYTVHAVTGEILKHETERLNGD